MDAETLAATHGRRALRWFIETKKRQGSKCALCLKAAKLQLDHNHVTGMLRGLICQRCNNAIKGSWDDQDWRARAAAYLANESELQYKPGATVLDKDRFSIPPKQAGIYLLSMLRDRRLRKLVLRRVPVERFPGYAVREAAELILEHDPVHLRDAHSKTRDQVVKYAMTRAWSVTVDHAGSAAILEDCALVVEGLWA